MAKPDSRGKYESGSQEALWYHQLCNETYATIDTDIFICTRTDSYLNKSLQDLLEETSCTMLSLLETFFVKLASGNQQHADGSMIREFHPCKESPPILHCEPPTYFPAVLDIQLSVGF
mmetsp:Transcript_707/g.4530  ORF Transcript_707/g.4530 Transcript_707/m.4530 type:complete len:118 (+) Transcript_707:1330-1683(+)